MEQKQHIHHEDQELAVEHTQILNKLNEEIKNLHECLSQHTIEGDETLEIVQQLITELEDKLYSQSLKIQMLENKLQALQQDVSALLVKIDDLQSHLDNGWRNDFINMLKKDYQQIVSETLQMALEMNRKQTEQVIENMKTSYDAMMETYKITKEKKTVDRTQLWLSIFGGGGLLYLLIEHIIRLFVK